MKSLSLLTLLFVIGQNPDEPIKLIPVDALRPGPGLTIGQLGQFCSAGGFRQAAPDYRVYQIISDQESIIARHLLWQ